MLAAAFQCLPSDKARPVYTHLNGEAEFCGRVPDLSELVVVSDPESVLSVDERRLITTGIEDEMVRATYDLMSLQLVFALRFGYSWNWQNGDQANYMKRQLPWRDTSVNLLRWKLGKEPSHTEIAQDYALNVGSSFYVREILTNPDKVVKEHDWIPIPSRERAINILSGDGDYPEIHSTPPCACRNLPLAVAV